MAMSKIRVLGARVLVDLDSPDEEAGGIIIPDTAKQPTLRGTVVRVGPGSYTDKGQLVPPCVKPEDRVVLQAFTGAKVIEDGKEYLLVNDRDILCGIDEGHEVSVTPDESALGVTLTDKK
jgi:chaperonin GroES